ncbi:MAG: hypothetical protein Tsb0020_19110 [Haliangiales bacterium]
MLSRKEEMPSIDLVAHALGVGAQDSLPVALQEQGEALALCLLDESSVPTPVSPRSSSPVERILDALASAFEPVTRRELRARCQMRTVSLSDALAQLRADGCLVEHSGRLSLAEPWPFSVSSL